MQSGARDHLVEVKRCTECVWILQSAVLQASSLVARLDHRARPLRGQLEIMSLSELELFGDVTLRGDTHQRPAVGCLPPLGGREYSA